MALRSYEFYPADPDTLRQQAYQARESSAAVYRVSDDVKRKHRSAVAATDGMLTLTLAEADGEVTGYTSDVNRAAIWAALQVENFADAIEVYNRDSTDPYSIMTLNAQVSSANSLGILTHLCIDPSAAQTGMFDKVTDADLATFAAQKEQELQATLDGHFRRLEANLDTAAAGVARALGDGPDDDAILAAWKGGNLPPYAALAWPHLGLDDVPINGVDADLVGISWRDFPGVLTDPKRPLSEAELEWLQLNFPTEMEQFSRNWQLDPRTLPAGESPVGMEDISAPHGWIQGPDGRWYPVQVPEAPPPPDEPVFVQRYSTVGGLYGDGWVTSDHRQGPVYAGEQPNRVLNFLAGLSGGAPRIYGDLSAGENQTDFLGYDSDGNVYTLDQTEDKTVPWGLPRGMPNTPLSSPPPGSYNPVEAMESSDRYIRTQAASGALTLVIGGAKGLLLNDQIDANNSYAGNVAFQEGPGELRRAVIQLGQIQYDQESGDIIDHPYRTYGVVNEDGEIRRHME